MWLENEIIYKNKNEIGRPTHDILSPLPGGTYSIKVLPKGYFTDFFAPYEFECLALFFNVGICVGLSICQFHSRHNFSICLFVHMFTDRTWTDLIL